MKVIAFDFDGVLVDSFDEIYSMYVYASKQLNYAPLSKKVMHDKMAFIGGGENFAALNSLVKQKKEPSLEALAKERERIKEECRDFVKVFYGHRHEIMEKDTKAWIKLFKPHREIIDLLKELSKSNEIFIATTRDKKSVTKVLHAWKLNIKEENITGRDVSNDKGIQLKAISKMKNIRTEDIIFVDDILEHVLAAREAGVTAIFANWGFTSKDHLREAKKRGIKIATKKTLEKIIEKYNTPEFFDVVDEKDKVIDKASREECHKKGLWHRAVHTIVISSEGKLLLQKRSKTVDLYKGHWIDGAAGHVASSEDYDETAERELKEELGLEAPLEKAFYFKKYTGEDNEFIKVFYCRSDGPFKIDERETEFVKFFSLQEISEMIKKDHFTPATLIILNKLLKNPELLKRLGVL